LGALDLDVPANIVKLVPFGSPGSAVTYPAPTASGGTAPYAISCSSASGAFYPIGVTTVTCSATDSEGLGELVAFNDAATRELEALTASNSFTITVIEEQAATTIAGIANNAAPPIEQSRFGQVPPVVDPGGELPATGSGRLGLLALAAALIACGAILLAARRPTVGADDQH